MKKIKIMLTTIIILGAVGGVLAIKAKRTVKFCTTATVNGICPVLAECKSGTIQRIDPAGAIKCYVFTLVTADCAIDRPWCHSTPAKLTAN